MKFLSVNQSILIKWIYCFILFPLKALVWSGKFCAFWEVWMWQQQRLNCIDRSRNQICSDKPNVGGINQLFPPPLRQLLEPGRYINVKYSNKSKPYNSLLLGQQTKCLWTEAKQKPQHSLLHVGFLWEGFSQWLFSNWHCRQDKKILKRVFWMYSILFHSCYTLLIDNIISICAYIGNVTLKNSPSAWKHVSSVNMYITMFVSVSSVNMYNVCIRVCTFSL